MAGRLDLQLPESPFEHLLHSNISADQVDTESLGQFIQTIGATISAIKTELNRIDAYRKELDDALPLFLDFSEQHSRLLIGGCRRLPAEILGTIFMQCVLADKGMEEENDFYSERTASDIDSDESSVFDEAEEEDNDDLDSWTPGTELTDSEESDAESFMHPYPERLATMQAPWVLTQVCSFWREVALNSPKIWSCIAVDHELDLFGWRKPSYSILRRHLELSGFQPLTIEFFCAINTGTSRQLLGELIAHADRWEEATIQLPTSLLPLLSLTEGRLSLLRTITISFTNSRDELPPLDPTFQTAAKLERTNLPSCFVLPCYRLTHVTLQDSSHSLLAILGQLTVIEECEFAVMTDNSPLQPFAVISDLTTQLRRLSLSGKCDGITRILNATCAPILEALSVLSSEVDQHIAVAVDEFIDRSKAPIRKLILRTGIVYDQDSTSRLFDKLSNIEEMSLGIKSDYSFLQFKDGRMVTELKKLKKLHLHIEEGQLEKIVKDVEMRLAWALYLNGGKKYDVGMDLELCVNLETIDWAEMTERCEMLHNRGLDLVIWDYILCQRDDSPRISFLW
ncbi:hypothetical protein C8J56DRAFT_12030 [Mycena floridula]|nr:hypothetical protein C8J56DRAFT_12030 [Mycena floridula]